MVIASVRWRFRTGAAKEVFPGQLRSGATRLRIQLLLVPHQHARFSCESTASACSDQAHDRLWYVTKEAFSYISAVKIRVASDGKGVDTNVQHSMNPLDEIVVEEAVRLRERYKGVVDKIVCLRID